MTRLWHGLTWHALTSVCAMTIVWIAWSTGGIDAPVLAWLMVLPLGPFYWLGKRHGYVWLAIGVGLLSVVAWLAPYQALPQGEPDLFSALGHFFWVSLALVLLPWRYHQLSQQELSLIHERTQTFEAKRAELQATQAAWDPFVASISHALRTPMHVILGFNERLLLRVENPQARDILQHTQASADHLLTVINDLLDHSQLETGTLRVHAEDHALHDVIYKAWEMLAFRARSQGLDYSHHIAQDVPTWIHTDPHRLTQVLVNLLGNAIKFTATGFVRLEVQTQNEGVLFTVQDSGIGIAEDKQGRIFQRFEQADAHVQGRFGGHGLGLNISSQIVRALGGEIGFSSEPGKGSRFWFWLPLQRVAVPERRQPSSVSPTVEASQAWRFLIVDDQAIHRQLVTHMLRSAWPRSVCVDVASGQEALDVLHTQDFDVIFMDLVMPDLNGIDTTQQLRAWPAPKGDTPVLGVTAHVGPQDLARFTQAGAQAVLLKPFGQASLLAQTQRLLAHPSAARQPFRAN